MEELIKKIEELKDWELLNAYKKHGKHHSRHEAFAVLMEEFEEAQEDLAKVTQGMKHLWGDIKADEENLRQLNVMLANVQHLAAEAVQVAAMVQKFIDFENNVKEVKQ